MHWLSTLFYMEAKTGPLEKRIKKGFTSTEMKFLKTAATPFLTTEGMNKLWKSLK